MVLVVFNSSLSSYPAYSSLNEAVQELF